MSKRKIRLKKQMIKIYNMEDYCWMGYKICKGNPYSFHHLDKIEDGGELTIKNGAILTKDAHDYLHIIETYDLDMYIYLNNILRKVNEQGYKPNIQQLIAIDEMLKLFEKEHEKDKSSKGNLLIKKTYYNRIYYKR